MPATGVKKRYIIRKDELHIFVEALQFSGSVPTISNKARGTNKDGIQSEYEKFGFDY